MNIIKGVYPVLPTLFNDIEEVDIESMEKLVEVLILGGVHGIAIFGIGSEFYKLSENEKKQILKSFIKAVNNRVTTIVSITDHSTKNACAKALEVQEAGANAIMILPPFFANPDTPSVYKHIYNILKTIDIPAIIQYTPEGTNFNLSEEVFLKLIQEFKDRIYFKIELQLSGFLISKLVNNGAKVLCGRGGITFFESLERGAVGVMPGCSLYDFFLSIYKSYITGEKESAYELFNKIIPYLVFADQSTELFLSSEKYILKMRGLINKDYCRSPFLKLDDNFIKLLNKYRNIFTL
ncbi:MAG: dihydrodipicolinate synthase family protein [Cyanobacteria bacterium]|nr:dihydrodipicolinate synthase family protein [Cyanobacteriota bacterium]